MRIYSLSVRNRSSGLLLALAVLGAGAALLLVGVALLATLAVAGAVVGSGVALYARLRGRNRPALGNAGLAVTAFDPALDPVREVFPRPGTGAVRALPTTREEPQ
jgi:hypothetical protein